MDKLQNETVPVHSHEQTKEKKQQVIKFTHEQTRRTNNRLSSLMNKLENKQQIKFTREQIEEQALKS